MRNPILIGKFSLKLIKAAVDTRQDIGMTNLAITHEFLDNLKKELPPIVKDRITFEDCEIVEGKESVLPF